MPIVGLIDAGVVAFRLQASGWEKEVAEDLYGQLTGFAAPLIGFPQILIQSVVVSLVPLVAAAKQKKDVFMLRETLQTGYRIAMILGMPCVTGLIALAKPILLLLYPTQKASAIHAAPCLQLLGLGFLALTIVQVSTGAVSYTHLDVYKRQKLIRQTLKLSAEDVVIPVSALKKTGYEELLDVMEEILED